MAPDQHPNEPPHPRRVPNLDPEELSQRQLMTFERLSHGPRGGVRGPFEAWINAPELADRAEALGTYLRFGAGLPLDLIELTVLATAAHWGTPFVFSSHEPLARSAGVDATDIDDVRLGNAPELSTEAQRAAYELVVAALKSPTVNEGAWQQAQSTFTAAEVTNLIALAGYYGMVCMTVNAYGIGTPTDLVADRPATD